MNKIDRLNESIAKTDEKYKQSVIEVLDDIF